jgi:hypothetical protein
MTPVQGARAASARAEPAPVQAARAAIARGLFSDPVTSEPMNALAIWTELGKGLCGTLDRKGADVGLLGRIVDRWCAERGAVDADLGQWAYRVDPSLRLSADDLALALQHIERQLEPVLGLAEAARGSAPAPASGDVPDDDDGGRARFLLVVRAWFPLGLTILRSFPRARAAYPPELLGALRSWCSRFLPHDPSGPSDLGVRVVKQET